MLESPLSLSHSLLTLFGTQTKTHYFKRIPAAQAIVISNHRSFLDAPVLMNALKRPIRFACHHYMGQVPLLREFVEQMGGFPLAAPQQRQLSFFRQSMRLLKNQQSVGIFPEGTRPMVEIASPCSVYNFHRGFAHLALRSPIENLPILPVAIASKEKGAISPIPLRLFGLFDPSEPLFDQPGFHPVVIYNRVDVLVGNPIWITQAQRQNYQGKQAGEIVEEITVSCQQSIAKLLQQGLYQT
ncbi:MAG: 1-acyl-sn-glycerol-3-phosphate acyltransferase [Leptolyngbyaceae cyanobacterium SM1_1_3]|nr:1-acyl-sn-glycerol-3-phosphate acyltransferase [Leptolyngbyaceae cyanobacterium SM1_1_3]NJN04409.1 1-acyl-sn-glycerol-3-phosphate acyltransferase [Leptolyngbyaceae cyanobacterium RM1_1_2]